MSERGCRSRWHGLSVLLLLAVFGGWATAQADGTEDLRPLMAMLRGGTWELEAVEQVVRGLCSAEELAAAGWWVIYAEEALAAGKLPRSATKGVRALRREWLGRASPRGELRQLVDRAVKHLEAVMRAKNHVLAGRVVEVIEPLLEEWPDAYSLRVLERHRERLAKLKEITNRDEKKLEAQERVTDELAGEIKKLIRARIDEDLESYLVAGCRPGRERIRRRILAYYGDVLTPSANERLNRLYEMARRLEAARDLEVWILGEPSFVRVYREEGLYQPCPKIPVDELTRVTFKVLPGDCIRLAPTGGREFHVKEHPGGQPMNSLLEVGGLLGGQPLPVSCWRCITRDELESSDPPLQPVAVGKKVTWSARYRGIGPRTSHVIEFGSGDARFALPYDERAQVLEGWLEEAGLAFDWITGTVRNAVYVIEVPEP